MPNNPFGNDKEEFAAPPMKPGGFMNRKTGKTFGFKGTEPEVEGEIRDLGIPGSAGLAPQETGLQKAGRIFGTIAKFI